MSIGSAGSTPPTTMNRDCEPIAALSSAAGLAGVAVIRVSSASSLNFLEKVGIRSSQAPGVMRRARFMDPETQQVIDDGMVCLFAAPKSFTGQHVAEIFCHGGPYVVRRLIAALAAIGVRQADPGEFTKRAFLNGKMDLTHAEGINDLIHAETEEQWHAARSLASGALSAKIDAIRGTLIEALALLTARIDFPDEGDTANVALKPVDSAVESADAQLKELADSFGTGQIAQRGLAVAIMGPPNSGKSSLLNLLVGEERAIVSEVAGTTRDYLEVPCLVHGRLVRLIDTAGIRKSEDTIEMLGIERALKIAAKADLILALSAPDAVLSMPLPSDVPHLRVATKADLAPAARTEFDLAISVKTHLGIGELKTAIASRIDMALAGKENKVLLTNERQLAAVKNAHAALERYQASRKEHAYDEMLAFELTEATTQLAVVIGKVATDDILDALFQRFCVGK